MYKAEGAGHRGINKDEGAGHQGMYKGGAAGHQGAHQPISGREQGGQLQPVRGQQERQYHRQAQESRRGGHHREAPIAQGQAKGREEATGVVNGYTRPVLKDKEGKRKKEVRELKYENGTTQVQPARYTTPHHYQERLATHVRKLEAEGVVERAADPTQAGEQGQGHHRLSEDGAGQTRLHGLPSRPRGPQAPGPQIGRAEGQGHEEEQPD